MVNKSEEVKLDSIITFSTADYPPTQIVELIAAIKKVYRGFWVITEDHDLDLSEDKSTLDAKIDRAIGMKVLTRSENGYFIFDVSVPSTNNPTVLALTKQAMTKEE